MRRSAHSCTKYCKPEVVQVVIFRLGRILGGGERGPGIFFILPCTDTHEIVDMRVQNFSVPAQVNIIQSTSLFILRFIFTGTGDDNKASL